MSALLETREERRVLLLWRLAGMYPLVLLAAWVSTLAMTQIVLMARDVPSGGDYQFPPAVSMLIAVAFLLGGVALMIVVPTVLRQTTPLYLFSTGFVLFILMANGMFGIGEILQARHTVVGLVIASAGEACIVASAVIAVVMGWRRRSRRSSPLAALPIAQRRRDG